MKAHVTLLAVIILSVVMETEAQAHIEQPAKREKEAKAFMYRDKGYFFQGHAVAEVTLAGAHVVNGYKFGQFAYIGLGTGFDYIISVHEVNMGIPDNRNNGFYIPLYVYYSGDVLKKRITPFYVVEAGYAFSLSGNKAKYPDHDGIIITESRDGFTGSAGFGVKFNTNKRFNFNIVAVADVRIMHYIKLTMVRDYGPYSFNISKWVDTLIFPGLRFGFSF